MPEQENKQNNKPPQPKKHKNISLHKAEHDPRAAALVAISKVLDNNQPSQEALDEVISSPAMVPTDKRLCTELLYGTLRHYTRLWWFASRCLPKPEKLPDEMKLVLVVALYEMTFLRIPHHASVGWAVTHIRNRFGMGLSKVCNGALRTMQRRLRDFHRPEFYAANTGSPAESLAVMHSCPAWLVEMWLKAYGDQETYALLNQSLETPPSGLRLNMQKADWKTLYKELLEAEVTAKKTSKHLTKYVSGTPAEQPETPPQQKNDCLPANQGQADNQTTTLPIAQAGLLFAGALPWQARGLEKQGKASRQSMASYAALMHFKPGSFKSPVWDACAGRGGKTMALLEMNVPVALATDTSEARLKGLALEYKRLGLNNLPCPSLILGSASELFAKDTVVICQPEQEYTFAPTPVKSLSLPDQFGTIVIDAPCSGFGTLARHPEIKYRRTPENVEQLVQTQKSLLESAAGRLSPGGSILYLTCTLNPAENQEQISTFLDSHHDYTLKESFEGTSQGPFREFFYGARLQKKQ